MPARNALPLLLVVPLLAACGVNFRDTFTGTEVFYGMAVHGERRPGSELTLDVTVTHGYPAPLAIGCYYEDGDKLTDDQMMLPFEQRATAIAEFVLPPAHGARPDAAPAARYTFPFTIPEAGRYFIACLTPAAADNGWGFVLTIRE